MTQVSQIPSTTERPVSAETSQDPEPTLNPSTKLDVNSGSVSAHSSKLIEMSTAVDKRGSAFVVVPEKGTVLMTRNEDGNYALELDGHDSQHATFTVNSKGKVLQVGETNIEDINSFHQPKLEMLNSYLSTLPTNQLQLTKIPAGELPKFELKKDVLGEALKDGYIDKTKLIRDIWAGSGGTPSKLKEVVASLDSLNPSALTPEFIDSVQKNLQAEAISFKGDPEKQIKQNRESLNTALVLADPELSDKLTQQYQKLTGDPSTNVVVSNSVVTDGMMAAALGDGNVVFSKAFYDSIVKQYPKPADHEPIILDVLKHERAHYTNGDSSSRQILLGAQTEYLKKTEKEFEDGTITQDQAVARVVATELLVRAESRNQERRADGDDGLKVDTVKAIEVYRVELEKRAEESAKQLKLELPAVKYPQGSLWHTHPPLDERSEPKR